ncbi:hypothetical protein AVEN_54979-1 [Araneus ventricosus]|uniref:Uncharacterized protein n=1 Tax=Araneus ventricosus TaxID=182803 RepID=A0A4Y2MSH8_ARAVE|nr:hypothetical protein AVEN_54979-1 [Araneus ventricosus]
MERRRNFIFDCLHYAKKLSTKLTVLWKFMRESRKEHSAYLRRPLWPSEISALGPEGFQVRNPIPLKICLVRVHTSFRWWGVEVWRGGSGSGVVFVI